MDAHIVPVPKWFPILRWVQLVVAFVVLGLTAYDVAWINNLLGSNGFYSSGPPFAIFVSIATIFITGYYFISTTVVKRIYNRGPILVLEVFTLLWWLGCFANLVYWSSWSNDLTTSDDSDTVVVPKNLKLYRGTLLTSAALSALEFLLFAITLITYIIRYRRLSASFASRQYEPYYGNSWQAPTPPPPPLAPPTYFAPVETKGAGMQGYEMQVPSNASPPGYQGQPPPSTRLA